MAQYFFDNQIRRFLLQFTRMFSNYYVEFTRDSEGERDLYRVPIRYGDASRQAQTILQNNSASSMPSTPLMTFYITALDYDRPRIQNPTFVQTTNVRQRAYCEETGQYTTELGNAFTVERLMPVPYKLSIDLDIWTSNTNQKWQILEQILVLFNPSLEIQATSNWFDWTTLSIVELVKTNYSSKSIPVGTEDPIDIATLSFDIPIFISSPLKVKKLGVVQKIIASVYESEADLIHAVGNGDLLSGTRVVITPYAYKVLLVGNRIQALQPNIPIQPPESSLEPPISPDSDLFWPSIVQMYGVIRTEDSLGQQDCIRPGISLIELTQPDGHEIRGTISYDPFDNRFLLFEVDQSTLPSNTLPPILDFVNPLQQCPGDGLPAAADGQRYLLTEHTGSTDGYAEGWAGPGGYLIAQKNDIIQYDGTRWTVAFAAADSMDSVEYVLNLGNALQFRWAGDTDWTRSYMNEYVGGDWRLIL